MLQRAESARREEAGAERPAKHSVKAYAARHTQLLAKAEVRAPGRDVLAEHQLNQHYQVRKHRQYVERSYQENNLYYTVIKGAFRSRACLAHSPTLHIPWRRGCS